MNGECNIKYLTISVTVTYTFIPDVSALEWRVVQHVGQHKQTKQQHCKPTNTHSNERSALISHHRQKFTLIQLLQHNQHFYLDVSVSIRDLHQKKFVQFLFRFLPRASSLSEQNKSALTDHASHDNHLINRPASTILDRESDKSTRWIKEAVHIRKEGWQSLNRDEGSYMLSDTYDRFLATSHHYRDKNRKRNWTNFFWWRSLIETETSR